MKIKVLHGLLKSKIQKTTMQILKYIKLISSKLKQTSIMNQSSTKKDSNEAFEKNKNKKIHLFCFVKI
jgi:hypothetical protein